MQPPGDRPRGRFARPRRRLRAGLVQLLCALAGLVLGLLLPRITLDSTVASTRVTETLVAVGFGILGLVTVIFSLLFLVVQWAFTSLSPRLTLFRDDPIVWRTFAFAVGVFVFSVTTALVVGDQEKVSVIVPAAEMVAVLAAIALIRSLQVKAFASIQLAPTLSAIAGQGRGVIDDLYPRPYTAGRPAAIAAPGGPVAAPAGDLAATRPGPAAARRRRRRDRAAGRHGRHAPAGRPGRRPARRRGDRHGGPGRAGDRARANLPPGSAVRVPPAGRHRHAGAVARLTGKQVLMHSLRASRAGSG
jgi:hypothetical protein